MPNRHRQSPPHLRCGHSTDGGGCVYSFRLASASAQAYRLFIAYDVEDAMALQAATFLQRSLQRELGGLVVMEQPQSESQPWLEARGCGAATPRQVVVVNHLSARV